MIAVLDADVAAVRHHRAGDEAREIRAESEDDERDHDARHEHHDLAQEVGDVG